MKLNSRILPKKRNRASRYLFYAKRANAFQSAVFSKNNRLRPFSFPARRIVINLAGKKRLLKTLTLLGSLTPKELRQFDDRIAGQQRAGLQRLYRYLKRWLKKAGKPEKAALFKATFQKAYSKKRDYLLRNELRLLNTALTDFITLRAAEEKIKSDGEQRDYFLLEGLRQRQLMDLYRKEFRGALERSVKKESMFIAEGAMHWHIYHCLIDLNRGDEIAQEVIDLCNERIRYLSQRYIGRVRKTEEWRANAGR